MNTRNELEAFAVHVVKTLRDHGHVAYFAGGCVRDKLLSVPPKDYDVATDAHPEHVRNIFGPRRTFAVGESFGVITVLAPRHAGHVEVATFRSDGPYSDGRRPDTVVYSSPQEDAARRDFTINGMFLDPITNEVIDFVDGQRDLRLRRIRAIGNPAARISEDRLRMLRAVRFAASYALDIEAETFAAIVHQSGEICCVSQERITNELARMFRHANRCRALQLLQASGLLAHVLPAVCELATGAPARWQRLLTILAELSEPTDALWLAVLYGRDGVALEDALLDAECRRLRVSNEVRAGVRWMVAQLGPLARSAHQPLSQLQPLLLNENIHAALALLEVLARIDHDPQTSQSLGRCRGYLDWPAAKLNPAPLIRGDDLRHYQLPPGPAYKAILARIRAAQLDEEISTRQQALALAQALARDQA